ncbi:MAG: undecaprenyl-diphosphate phosphatase [Rickettsiales bacterium]|jgi:undecaprenyl-diphosphatase|nr:undecaprenyl-diphosphate phosphatase [Rickettsiales bacterium]
MVLRQFKSALALLFVNTIIEFLPISSTAHSILINRFLDTGTNLRLLLAISQLAIDLVLCLHFRQIIWKIIRDFFLDRETRSFCYSIVLTSLPFLAVGALFHGPIRKYLYSSGSIALFLIIGGVFLIFTENHLDKKKTLPLELNSLEKIEPRDMYRIGLGQMISILPGVSRSACTLGSALLLGLARDVAVDFSFFISIPVGIAGSLFDLLGEVGKVGVFDFYNFFGYLGISIVFSLFFVERMLEFLKSRKLSIFGYYRIMLGLITLLFF